MQAINKTQNKKWKTNFNPLTIDDILDNPIINIKLNTKHEFLFTYDIKIKQDANTFLNNNFTYRIPEVSGSFTLNLDSEIIDISVPIINYIFGNYQKYINNVDSILTGSTNDFTLMMNEDDWSEFVNWTSHDTKWNSYDGGNAWLHFLNLNNSNIILNNEQWKLILNNLQILDVPEGYVACIHVIKISNKIFITTFNNLSVIDENNMFLPENEKPWLPLFAFNSNYDWEDDEVLAANNKFIALNKDILKELIDIYTDCNCQNYKSQNWNITTISQLLQTNHFCNTNLDLKTIATCLINNWNINLVNNFLASNHEYFLMQYDNNNNYVKNNWNM